MSFGYRRLDYGVLARFVFKLRLLIGDDFWEIIDLIINLYITIAKITKETWTIGVL